MGMSFHLRRAFALAAFAPFLLAGLASRGIAAEIVTTDLFITHHSIDDSYKQAKLDSTVQIHLREVVLAGNERRASREGKIAVFAHGATTPGYIAFDLSCEGCSIMRYMALAGWDTFTLDYEGYGRSTRQPTMEIPEAYPQANAPTHTEVAVDDLARVIEFIRNLRDVDKVYLLGWSLGASRTAPIYTIQNPNRVAKLVLFAPGYRNLGWVEALRGNADSYEKAKMLLTRPTLGGWKRFGATDESVAPGTFDAYRDAMLASDPRSGEMGGQVRYPAGRIADLLRFNPQFDAAKITVPTMVIRGNLDTFGTTADSQLLVKEIGAATKKFVEIPGGSHNLPYEKVSTQFFKAVQDFFEEK